MGAMSSPSSFLRHVRRFTADGIGARNPDLAGLIRSWPEVVGSEWAARTTPVELVPARADRPAGLKLAVPAGEILLVQHETPLLLARVNAYFGYAAIGTLFLRRLDVRTPVAATTTG